LKMKPTEEETTLRGGKKIYIRYAIRKVGRKRKNNPEDGGWAQNFRTRSGGKRESPGPDCKRIAPT